MDSRVSDILRHPLAAPTAVGLIAFGGGFAAGVWYKGRRPEEITVIKFADKQEESDVEPTKFDIDLTNLKEYADAREREDHPISSEGDGDVIRIDDPRPDPSTIEVEPETMDPVVPDDEETAQDEGADQSRVNVFGNHVDGWDYEYEIEHVRPGANIYILHKDEFFGKEVDYDQTQLTYYESDDIMTDMQDTPVYGYESLVGPLNFGHGTGDPNVVYVRNNERKSEYEIIRDPGSYSTEVLGIYAEEATAEDELRHSRALLKFRSE